MIRTGKDLKKLRKKMKWSQNDLAEKIHYRRWTISVLERTDKKLTHKMVSLINDIK